MDHKLVMCAMIIYMSLWKTLSANLINIVFVVTLRFTEVILMNYYLHEITMQPMQNTCCLYTCTLILHLPVANQHKKHLLLMFIVILWYIDLKFPCVVYTLWSLYKFCYGVYLHVFTWQPNFQFYKKNMLSWFSIRVKF